MSCERYCKCGKGEGIRFSFADEADEKQYFDREFNCDACQRKATPVYSGVLKYFPDAIADVARCSQRGNDQHNPGTELHWDRSKSGDELDALARHLMEAGTMDTDGIRHSAKVAWRALANLQKEIENERELKLQDWQEEVISKSMEEDLMYDEEYVNARMNIIGRNGNEGSHYDLNEFDELLGPRFGDSSLSQYPESNWTETRTDEV